MPNVGPLELAIVLIVALLVLGPKRLPEVGRSLGNGIREFKDSLSSEGHHDEEVHVDVEHPPAVTEQVPTTEQAPATTAATPTGAATPPPPPEP